MRDKYTVGTKVNAPDYNDVIRVGTVLDRLSTQLFVRFDDDLAPNEVFISTTDKRLTCVNES